MFKVTGMFIVQRNFCNILYDYVQKYNILKTETLRKYGKLKIKILRAELDLTFLTNCQTLNVYPKFLTFNFSNVSSHDARFIRKLPLCSAIKKRKKRGSLRKDTVVYEKDLAKVLSSIDKYILDNVIKKNVYKCAVKTIKTHEKKLRNLTKNVTLPFRDTETVHNLSNVTLTTEELELLKYGLKHPIHPLQVNKTDILTTFDFIHCAMTKDLRDEKQSGEVKTKISNLGHSYVNSYKPTLHALKKHWSLERLANYKDIVILRPDKGSGTVILNRDGYIKKLSDIIHDTSKFKKLSADPTLLRKGQLQCFLRKL